MNAPIRFHRGNQRRVTNPVITCRCGCGEKFNRFDESRRPRTYINGHTKRGKSKVRLTRDGQTKSLIDWADELGLCYETLRWRIRQGWEVTEVLSEKKTKGPAVGDRFGRWTVQGRADDHITRKLTKIPRARCKCDCGTIRDVTWNSLRRGLSTSCRCSMRKSEA